MDATRDYHTKWSESDRERQLPYGITFMWSLKYDTTNLWHRNRLTDTEKKINGSPNRSQKKSKRKSKYA